MKSESSLLTKVFVCSKQVLIIFCSLSFVSQVLRKSSKLLFRFIIPPPSKCLISTGVDKIPLKGSDINA